MDPKSWGDAVETNLMVLKHEASLLHHAISKLPSILGLATFCHKFSYEDP